jgi:hypothetical protein
MAKYSRNTVRPMSFCELSVRVMVVEREWEEGKGREGKGRETDSHGKFVIWK